METCKACGHQYAASARKCPHCGAPAGSARAPYVRCLRCGTVMTARHKECKACGQPLTPQTAVPAPRPRKAPRQRRPLTRRQMLVWGASALGLVILLVAEGFLVAGLYERSAYRHTLELWESGGPVEQNLREPDPVYRETELPEVPEELFDSLAAEEQPADSLAPEHEAPVSEEAPAETDEYFTQAEGAAPSVNPLMLRL